MTSPIARLNEFGQAPWYDNVNRVAIQSGALAHLIAADGIRGGTSNPTIIEAAISGSDAYDGQLEQLARSGTPTDELYWELLVTDIDQACTLFRPVHDEHGDGFVSIELDPTIAGDAGASVEQARLLHSRLLHPNVMVKIPGTAEGLTAVEETVAEGGNVNVTLIFGLDRYAEVIEAYLRGLERHAEAGGDVSRVFSVASFFVSRVDSEVDARLAAGHPLRGRAAVANAKLAYRLFRKRFAGERWAALAERGANLQRPLWASTSTKNPAYSDTLYVDELVGRDTVNTLADASVDALRDHGDPRPDTVEFGVDDAEAVMAGLADAGIDFADVTATLEREGVEKFAVSFRDALDTIDKRRAEI